VTVPGVTATPKKRHERYPAALGCCRRPLLLHSFWEGQETFPKGEGPCVEIGCPVSVCCWGRAVSQTSMTDESRSLSVFLCYWQTRRCLHFNFIFIDKPVMTDPRRLTGWERFRYLWLHGLRKHMDCVPAAKPHQPPTAAPLHGCFGAGLRSLLRNSISCVSKHACRQALGPCQKTRQWER